MFGVSKKKKRKTFNTKDFEFFLFFDRLCLDICKRESLTASSIEINKQITFDKSKIYLNLKPWKQLQKQICYIEICKVLYLLFYN